jgi:hypothetical protein
MFVGSSPKLLSQRPMFRHFGCGFAALRLCVNSPQPVSKSGKPGIALLLAHCLAARPLPPAYGLGDGAKPPETWQ